MNRGTVDRWWWVGALALLIGLLALAVPPHPFGEQATWKSLLSPYSTGAALPDGFRIRDIRRGPENGVVVSVQRPEDGAAIEVVVVERGRWTSVHQSQSFTIDYELPRSPAAEREVITALLADTIRSRDRGLPAPDAVPLEAGDPSVLPWWLEMLRGTRGMLFGASLVVLGLLGLLRSPALAWVGVVLGVSGVATRLAGVSWLRPDIGGVWIVSAAAGLLFVALSNRSFRSGRSALWLASAVAAVALLLRLALGPWGPLHVNGHGPRFVAGAVHDPADIAAYGPGFHEIFGPIAALAPENPDWAIFAANALFSALLPPLAFAIGRMTGLATSAAVVAALLLAIDPIAIRMGATEAYFAAIALLCTAASAAMLVALRATEAGRWRAAALLVAAGLLLSEAARIHPCAWVVMATVPFVLVAGNAGSWRRRMLMVLAAAVVSGGVLVFTSATPLLDVLGNIRTGTVFRPPPPSPWPLAWIALPAAVYVAFAPRRWLALPAGIAVAAMVLTRSAFDASWIWEQSYFRLYLTLPVIAAVGCVPAVWLRRRRLVVPAVMVLVLGWIGFGWPIVTSRAADQREYHWVREQLRRLPPECRIVHLGFAGSRVLALPTYVGRRPAVAMNLRRPRTVEAALAPAACLYYVHSSLCSTSDGRSECDAIERRLTLVPIARASFPTIREHGTFAHDGDVVETWIARVERVDGG